MCFQEDAWDRILTCSVLFISLSCDFGRVLGDCKGDCCPGECTGEEFLGDCIGDFVEDWKEELGLCIFDDFDLWVISVVRIGQILSSNFPRSTYLLSKILANLFAHRLKMVQEY